jgi:sporulation protein YlmC with PRC-barrel domain
MKVSLTETKRLVLFHWEYVKSMDVYTKDGRNVGITRGILIDPDNWTVPQLVFEVNVNILEELDIEIPLLKVDLVNIPTSLVKEVSNVVLLNSDFHSMKGVVSLYTARSVSGAHTSSR